MTIRAITIRSLAVLFGVAGLSAQTPQAAASLAAQDRPGIAAGAAHDLTLEDLFVAVLRNSPDIEAARLDLEAAYLNVKAAYGAYDPTLSWDNRYQKKATPVSSILGGAADGRLNETNLSGTPTLGGLAPFGGNWSISAYAQKATSSSMFVPLNPQFLTGAVFRFTEPLWRDRGIDAARRGIRVANWNRNLSTEQFRARVNQIISQAAKMYFDLASAQENLEIQRNAYDQAQRSLATNQRMAAQGLLATTDVVSARTQVSTYQTAWYRAQDQMAAVENALKAMMLTSRGDPLWNAWLRPVSSVTAPESRIQDALIPMDEAIETALRNRPEVAQLKSARQIADVNTQYFTNQTRPQVDLYGSYTGQGLAGALAPRAQLAALAGFPASVPPNLLGSVWTGIGSVLQGNYPTFEGGVRISVPIRNRTAEANLGLAEVDARRLRNQTNQLEQSIVAEVRNAAQTLTSARARLAAATVGRESAQLEYDGEQRRLQVGLTSVFELFQQQTRLVEAQGREVQARTDLRKAVIEMERATGRTLDVYRINIDTAATSSTRPPAR